MVVTAKTVLVLLIGLVCGLVLSPMTSLLLLVPRDHDKHHYDGSRRLVTRESPPFTEVAGMPPSYAAIEDDLSARYSNLQLVGVSVLSSPRHLHGRATAAYNTYGRNLLKDDFKVYTYPTGITNKKRKNNRQKKETPFSIKYMKSRPLQESVNSTITINSMKSHLIHLLEHVCQTKVYTNYHFLLLVHDDTYVNVKNLHRLADSFLVTSVQPPLYTSSHDQHQSRHNLPQCSTKNGLLMHQTAFKKLCPNIHHCSIDTSSRQSSESEDKTVNKCLEDILSTSCWNPTQVNTIFYQDKENKLKSMIDSHGDNNDEYGFNDSGLIKDAVTIYPVSDSTQFSLIHQIVSEMRVNSLLKETKSAINSLMTAIPEDAAVATTKSSSKWLSSYLNINPKSKHEIVNWLYCDSSRVYQLHEHKPSQGLLNRHRTSINNALQVAVEKLNNTEEERGELLLPPYKVSECFIAVDESKGMKYILSLSAKKKYSSKPEKYVASVTLPLNRPGFSTSRPVKDFADTIVNLVLPIAPYHDLIPFLEMYENEFLVSNELVHIHMVFFSRDEVIRRKIAQIEHIYSSVRVTIHNVPGNKPYSIFYAYNHVAEKLSDADLMLFYDVRFRLSKQFLGHCRMNTVKDKQVYSPIAFSQYKPEMVNTLVQKDNSQHITADTGFFLRYNYQAMCIYRSDFAKVGGYRRNSKTSEAQGNEEVHLLENILKSSVYFMRSVEPFLVKSFHSRKCKDLKSESARESCVKSVADSIGSKKSLGMYLLNHDLL